jgi:hypothetical protein
MPGGSLAIPSPRRSRPAATPITGARDRNQLATLTSDRNAEMIGLLEAAEFGGQPISEQQAQSLVSQALALIAEANALAS